MPKTPKYWSLIRIAGASLLLSIAAAGQTSRYNSVPTGRQPLGVAARLNENGQGYAVVANSGDNSVSIFQLNVGSQGIALSLSATLTGIPSPYAVADCGNGTALVTSPSDNSVRLIQVSPGQVLGTLKTGPQPYSVACYFVQLPPFQAGGGYKGVVSNLGDSSVVIFDVATLTITATLQGVPGSRGFHGVATQHTSRDNSAGVVAGTDGNVITVLALSFISPSVLGRLPVARPTAVFANHLGFQDSRGGGGYSFWATSAPGNSLFLFEGDSGRVDKLIQNVPNPQDATGAFLDFGGTIDEFAVVINGGADSISGFDSSGNVTTLPGIPEPTSVALLAVPSFLNPGSVAALVTSSSTHTLYVVYFPAGAPSQLGISNAASFARAQVAPGTLASLFASTGVSQNFWATSLPLPKTLGGVTLKIGGSLNFNTGTGNWEYSSTGSIDAPLHFVGPNQINFQVPPGISLGDAVPAQLTKPDGTTLLTTVRITATAPGIFSVLMNGQGQGAVLNQDNSQNFGTNPAKRGSVIQIFATGAGETDPPLLPGEAASVTGNPLVYTRLIPTVTIGGIQAKVQFSGMAPGYVGLWQINAEVPANTTPGTAVPLVVTAGGISSNTVTIAVL